MTHEQAHDRMHGNPTAYVKVTTAPGGWSADSADGMSSRSGMREQDILEDTVSYPDNATLIDLNTMSWSDVHKFVINGPMYNPTIPSGYLSRIEDLSVPRKLITFDPTPVWPNDGRDPRFGNALAFDYAAHDVYCTLVLRFGGRVMTMGDYRAERGAAT